jgi:RNA polymerase sigma-70 factor (ECF subfamily)
MRLPPDAHPVIGDPDAFLNDSPYPVAPTLLRNKGAWEQQGGSAEGRDLLSDHLIGAAESLPAEQQPAEAVLTSEQAAQQSLLTGSEQGDTEAFARIVEQYRGLMVSCAYLILRNPQSAEDVAQEALLLAWQHLPGLREVAAVRRWLLRIVVNQSISKLRQLKSRAASLQQYSLEQSSTSPAQEANEPHGHLERDWDLRQAVGQLPPKQQEAILLHYYRGMTLPAMAHALRTSQNTLKKRLLAALKCLRNQLDVP